MIAAVVRDRVAGLGQRFELGNFNAYLFGPLDEVLPSECSRPLRRELVIERHRVVVVQENEMSPNRKLQPRPDNKAMLDGTGDRANVHDMVGADEVIVLNRGIHVQFLFCVIGD
jgi:hypothetical protein